MAKVNRFLINLILWDYRRKLKKYVLNFLFNQKMLTGKTEKRLNKVISQLVLVRDFEVSYNYNLSIERMEMMTLALEGLIAYGRGDEKGFKIYEDNNTEYLLKEIISGKYN